MQKLFLLKSRKRSILLFFFTILFTPLFAGDIPQNVNYTKIYDFLDELANDGIIEIRSVVKPYSRMYITQKLSEAKRKEELLNQRQQKELYFYLNDYALEQDKLPETKVNLAGADHLTLALIQPAFHYKDSLFKCRITPIIGGEFYSNKNGFVANRSVGAGFQATIAEYITIFGSLRDVAFRGELLSEPNYLNNMHGYQYKESSTESANYSDSRGGIKLGCDWGSVGLVKEQVSWGDNYNGSNILSDRAPSSPMLTLQLKPVKWFQLDYFHAWLVSNVTDSNYYYLENEETKHYRPANKFMAANMLTFTPVRKLNISFGNSIIYAERNVLAAYFIPVAFYKSIDHTLTKGLKTENQNSQMFFNISSRNLKHTHFYTSVFIDEFSFARLKPGNTQHNPVSYKAGARLNNWPVRNLAISAEYTHTNIINYKHSIPNITYTSNDYCLGHYLKDNAQEIYAAITYKPVRGLSLTLSYLNAQKGNEYEYLRRKDNQNQINNIISQDFMKDVVWTNETYSFNILYEVFNNCYAGMNVEYSNIKAYNPKSEPVTGEIRLNAQEYLNLYTPKFFQGKNLTFNMLLTVGF